MPILLLVLGIVAPLFLRVYDNNSLVLTLLVLAIAYAVFVYLGPSKSMSTYAIALFAISLSILICFNLRTNHVFGNDINLELYTFKLTFESGYWNPSSLYSSCLSITILPAVVSSLTGISGELIFKLMYPFILSFIPVLMYSLYQRWLGKSLSFGVSMFMIASTIYLLHMPSLARQIVALFLFVLVFFLIFRNKGRRSHAETFCIILLSFGVITSHYTVGLIFITTLFALTFYTYMRKLIMKMRKRPNGESAVSIVPLSHFLIIFSLGLLWYGFATQVPLDYSISSMRFFIDRFSEFLNLSSRSSYALELVGIIPRQGLPNIIGYWLGNLIRGLIVLGLLASLLKKSLRFHFKIRREFVLLGIISILGLFSALIIPYVTTVMNLDRLYLISLVFLLPFLGVGAAFLSLYIHRLGVSKKKALKIILSAILIVQMFYATGLLNQITGYPSFVVLNSFDTSTNYNDLSPDSRYFIFDGEISSINWMANFIPSSRLDNIVADPIGKLTMSSYGLIHYNYENELRSDESNYLIQSGNYFYLRYENTKYGKIYVGTYILIGNLTSELLQQNRIYDNSISTVYSVP